MDGTNLLHYHFYPLVKRAGLPRMRFHDLRHTFATLAFAQRISAREVQEFLGHSTIAITLDTYTHSVPELQRQAILRLNDALFGDEREGAGGGQRTEERGDDDQ